VLRRRRDDGFTLVELLLAVGILGILLAAITSAMFVALRATASTTVRLAESNDGLFLATYFGDDVQGAKTVTVGTTAKCGTSAGTAVVEFVGQDFADDTSYATRTTVVTYVLRTVTVSGTTSRQLRRLLCAAATDSPTYPLTPTAEITVADRLSSTAPAVTCGSAGCAAFSEVSMTMQEESGGFTYTLTGRRRTT